jgi:hypothetical protein
MCAWASSTQVHTPIHSLVLSRKELIAAPLRLCCCCLRLLLQGAALDRCCQAQRTAASELRRSASWRPCKARRTTALSQSSAHCLPTMSRCRRATRILLHLAAHIHRQGKWLDPHGHRRASTQERRGAGETEWRGAVPPVRANRAYSQGVQQAPSDASAPDRTSRP